MQSDRRKLASFSTADNGRKSTSDYINPENKIVRSRQIWVDADACPKAIKEILFRAADRVGMVVTLVANQLIHIPKSRHIRSIRVASGFDITDNYIVQQAEAGDLVITADVPLAAEVIAKGCIALDPRGELYTDDNIRQRLSMRDFMDTLRGIGVDTGGPGSFRQADRQAFANQLDRWLASGPCG